MNHAENDVLLKTGKVIALILQGLCALAGGVALLLIAVVLLASQGMAPAFLDIDGLPSIAASPLAVIGIALLIAVSLTALFTFFGKMRAIISSVSAGDPFIPENAQRLNAMAWLLLVHEVVAVLVGVVRVYLANFVDGAADTKSM